LIEEMQLKGAIKRDSSKSPRDLKPTGRISPSKAALRTSVHVPGF